MILHHSEVEFRAHVANPVARCRCGRLFADGEPLFIGKTRAGRGAIVSRCCRRRLVKVHGFGMTTISAELSSPYADMAERAGLEGLPIYIGALIHAIARGDGRGVSEMGVRAALARRGAEGRA